MRIDHISQNYPSGDKSNYTTRHSPYILDNYSMHILTIRRPSLWIRSRILIVLQMYTIHSAIEAGIISNTKNENSISYTSYVIYPSFSLLFSLSLSLFYMPFSFAFYRGFINRQGNLLPSIPPSLVHPFFLLPPTPRRSLAAREYGIEGRIITEKKKKKWIQTGRVAV